MTEKFVNGADVVAVLEQVGVVGLLKYGWVAKECRRVWDVARFGTPAPRTAALTARCVVGGRSAANRASTRQARGWAPPGR